MPGTNSGVGGVFVGGGNGGKSLSCPMLLVICAVFAVWQFADTKMKDERLHRRFQRVFPTHGSIDISTLELKCSLDYFDDCSIASWFKGGDDSCKFAHKFDLSKKTATDADGTFVISNVAAWADASEGARSLHVAFDMDRSSGFSVSARAAKINGVVRVTETSASRFPFEGAYRSALGKRGFMRGTCGVGGTTAAWPPPVFGSGPTAGGHDESTKEASYSYLRGTRPE